MSGVSLQRVARRRTNAAYQWLEGPRERCSVVTVGHREAYVSWPHSVRTVVINGRTTTGQRPGGWVTLSRLSLDSGPHTVKSPNGVDHLMVNFRCMTCGDAWRHAEWESTDYEGDE
jgi:hypothetical protein